MKMMKHRTDWFKDLKYGVFVHYLHGLQNDPESARALSRGKRTSWEECVGEFDVEFFAEQMREAGAGYVIFTLMQGTKHFCAPCATYDHFTGYAPGEACSRRDLIADLYDALNKRNIKLMLYTSGTGPRADEKASTALLGGFPFGVNPDFAINWSKCMKEISMRYGGRISGWWVDGCYVYKGYSEETFFKYMAPALRSGNPETIIAFNHWAGQEGYSGEALPVTELEDYTAGEIYQGLDKNHPYPANRWSGREQWHVLAFLGSDWAYPGTRYPDGYAAEYVKKCVENGGVVSIDVGLYREGGISEDQMKQLKQIRRVVR